MTNKPDVSAEVERLMELADQFADDRGESTHPYHSAKYRAALENAITAALLANAAGGETARMWANRRSLERALYGTDQTKPYLYPEQVAVDDVEMLIGAKPQPVAVQEVLRAAAKRLADLVEADATTGFIERRQPRGQQNVTTQMLAAAVNTVRVALSTAPAAPTELQEAVAKTIYEQWTSQPGYKSWVVGGNSLMQDKARDIARAALVSIAPAAFPKEQLIGPLFWVHHLDVGRRTPVVYSDQEFRSWRPIRKRGYIPLYPSGQAAPKAEQDDAPPGWKKTAYGWAQSGESILAQEQSPMARSTAKQRYDDIIAGHDNIPPIERLRFFCSLAMNAQDWLDVEQLFDALTTQERANDTPGADAARLDFLDAMNKRKNERHGTLYGWRLTENHNRIALEDHNYPVLSVRAAIDAARDAQGKESS